MHPRKRNDPDAWRCAGAGNVTCWQADDSREHSAKQAEIESYAAEYVARRYRLAPSVARLVCRLARIGEVLS